MKEINYDYLQSTTRSGKTSFVMLGVSFEDVMNLPIKYLNLEGYAKQLFVDNPFYVNGELKKMLTLGDLVNVGYDFVESRVQKNLTRETNLTIYKIQLALAKFSLKLKGTDFSVFEIDVSDLNLTKNALNWSIKNEFYTLGDFYLNAKRKLKNLDENSTKREIKDSVVSAMKRFGITFEKKKPNDDSKSLKELASGMFPDILTAIAHEKEKTAKTKVIGLEIFDNINYQNTECDYTKLITLIKLHFKTASDFLTATTISTRTLDKIVEGKELSDRALKKVYTYFKVTISDIVEFKTAKIKTNNKIKNTGIGTKYDFSKLFIKIRKLYGSRTAFRKITGISDSSLDSLAKGKFLSYKNMKKVCSALRCELEDIMEKLPNESEKSQEPIKTYYDYSKFKKLLKDRKLSLNKLLSGSEISRNYVGSLINSGKPLSQKHISVITSLLGCEEKDLYEIKTGENPYIQCDYSKLLALLNKRMISVNQLCKSTGLATQEILNRISKGKHLGQEKIEKITRFLGCDEDDILTNVKSREDVKELKRKAMKRLEPEIDYTKLFEKLKEEGLTLEEIQKRLSMSDLFTKYVKRNVKLQKNHIYKLCRYFKCQPEDLFDDNKKMPKLVSEENETSDSQTNSSMASKSNKTSSNSVCDYTNLLNLAVQNSKSLQDFTTKVGIHREYVTKINKGELLDFRIYMKLMDYLQKTLDEIVKFNNPADREKISKRISETQFNKNNPEVDYSGLYKKLSEKNLTDDDLHKNKVVSLNIVLYKIRESKEISTDTVQRICKFLDCEPSEIMKRLKPKKPDPKIKKPREPKVDYSILISLVDKQFLNLTQICRDVGINISFAHAIKMGKKIAQDKLEKICAYLGFKPEEIVFEIENETATQPNAQKSYVNSSFGGGVARVKPAFQNSQEETSTQMSNTEREAETYGITNPSTKPKDTKFYFTPKGYIKNPDIRFKSHKFSSCENLISETFEPTL